MSNHQVSKDHAIVYAAISERIRNTLKQRGIVEIEGITKERLAQLAEDATGISTLEVTRIAQASFVPINWLITGKR